MTYKLLLAASAFSIFASFGGQSAMAESLKKMENNTQQVQEESNSVVGTLKKGWDKTTDSVSGAAENVVDASKSAYENVKARVIDPTQTPKVTLTDIDPKMTAKGMLGEPVYNVGGERVAKVHDIILDENGIADMVVLADGDFTGMGKLVAFKFQALTIRATDGDLLTTLSEETIDEVAPFTYEKKSGDKASQTLGDNAFSLVELLDAGIVDATGKELADIENISFRGGKVDQVIAQFDDIFGIGGEKVAIGFNELHVVKNKDGYNFAMSSKQSEQFEDYKESIKG